MLVVINSWRTHRRNEAAQPGKDFIRMNTAAVKNGCTSAKELASFRSTVDIRLAPHKVRQEKQVPPVPPGGFGVTNKGYLS